MLFNLGAVFFTSYMILMSFVICYSITVKIKDGNLEGGDE